jgi:DeoR family transcriptional regulator, fructose operon transcriptional repressor
VESAAQAAGVSAMTMRRDLDKMEASGLLRRVHGGAMLAPVPEAFGVRRRVRSEAKRMIAKKALELVPTSGAIAADGSSTVGYMLSLLAPTDKLTVATNSLENLHSASSRKMVDGILIGGRLDTRTDCFVGPIAAATAALLSYQTFFFSAAAVEPQLGPSDTTIDEAQIKAILSERSHQAVLLVDSSKLGQRALMRTIDWGSIDALVTELDNEDERLAPYQKLTRVI